MLIALRPHVFTRLIQSLAALALALCVLSFPGGAQGGDNTPPPRLDDYPHWDLFDGETGQDIGLDVTATEIAPGMFAVTTAGTLEDGTVVTEYSTFYEVFPGWYDYENHTREMYGSYVWTGESYWRVSSSSTHMRELVPGGV